MSKIYETYHNDICIKTFEDGRTALFSDTSSPQLSAGTIDGVTLKGNQVIETLKWVGYSDSIGQHGAVLVLGGDALKRTSLTPPVHASKFLEENADKVPKSLGAAVKQYFVELASAKGGEIKDLYPSALPRNDGGDNLQGH